jgi:hypothetical protein
MHSAFIFGVITPLQEYQLFQGSQCLQILMLISSSFIKADHETTLNSSKLEVPANILKILQKTKGLRINGHTSLPAFFSLITAKTVKSCSHLQEFQCHHFDSMAFQSEFPEVLALTFHSDGEVNDIPRPTAA